MNHEPEKNEEETRGGSFEKIYGISEEKKEREGAETEKQGGKKKKKKDEKRWQKESGRKKETKNGSSRSRKKEKNAGRKTEKKKLNKRDNVLYLLNDQPSSGGGPCSPTKSVKNNPIAVDKSFDSFCNKWEFRDFASISLSCEAIRQLTDRLENAISKFELLANAFAQMGLIVHSSDDGGASDPTTQAETTNYEDFFAPIVMQNDMESLPTANAALKTSN